MRFKRLKRLRICVVMCAVLFSGCEDPSEIIQLFYSSAREISSFSITDPSAEGTVDEINQEISVTLPYGSELTGLVPEIVHTGESVSPASGETVDFSEAVTFTVTAEDGSTRDYEVTVEAAQADSCEITSFVFSETDTEAVINEVNQTIEIGVPEGTDLTSLTPELIHTGSSVSPASDVAQDFSSDVIYTVTAQDGTTRDYLVIISESTAPAAPVIEPGNYLTYQISVDVIISCETDGAEIHYTTNGKTPTKYSTDYEGAFTLTSGYYTTVKAIAIKDGLSSDVTTVAYSIKSNVYPVAEAGDDIQCELGESVVLDGSGSYDENGKELTYLWELTSAPEGSTAALSDEDQEWAGFVPDKIGAYKFTLTVNDGYSSYSDDDDNMTLYVHNGYSALDFNVIDSEYSTALDRLIMVSDSPEPALIAYDITTGETDSVCLPYTPRAVSVDGKDGQTAAVIYETGSSDATEDSFISLVDISGDMSLESTLELNSLVFSPNDMADVALVGDCAYMTVDSYNTYSTIMIVNFNTGNMFVSDEKSVLYDSVIRYNSSLDALYVIETNSSPRELVHYDMIEDSDDIDYVRDEDYNSYFYENFWISGDGGQCILNRGVILTLSDDEESEFVEENDLVLSLEWADFFQNDATLSLIKTDSGDDEDNTVYFYDTSSLSCTSTLVLPPFVEEGESYDGHGRFLFHDSTGDACVVLYEADSDYGEGEYAVVVYENE